MKSYLTIILIITACITTSTTAFSENTNCKYKISELVEQALLNNPEIKSSKARWQMFADRAKQASTLDDPMLMFKLQNLLAREPFSIGGKDPQTAKVIAVSQQLPFWGKRAIKQEIADLDAESYRWQIEERKLELARMVKENYYQLWSIEKLQQVIDKNLQIIADFITIAESRYSVGQGVQQDIYKAGLEKSKMLDMQITLRQQRKSLEANLNFLLYRPASTAVGNIEDFTLPQNTFTADGLQAIALEKRPQIKSLIAQINKSEANIHLAQKEFYPDFNLSFEYMFRQVAMSDPGYDMFTLAMTFNLPFQQKRRHSFVAEASSEREMASEELSGMKNLISYTINDTLAQLDRRLKLIELYKGGIIPQAEQSLESAVISYRVGKVDFLTLLDAQMSLLNYERELYMSQAEYMMGLAKLEAVVGMDLTSN